MKCQQEAGCVSKRDTVTRQPVWFSPSFLGDDGVRVWGWFVLYKDSSSSSSFPPFFFLFLRKSWNVSSLSHSLPASLPIFQSLGLESDTGSNYKRASATYQLCASQQVICLYKLQALDLRKVYKNETMYVTHLAQSLTKNYQLRSVEGNCFELVSLRNGCGHHFLRALFGAGGEVLGNKVGDGRENIRQRYTEALISLPYPFIYSQLEKAFPNEKRNLNHPIQEGEGQAWQLLLNSH